MGKYQLKKDDGIEEVKQEPSGNLMGNTMDPVKSQGAFQQQEFAKPQQQTQMNSPAISNQPVMPAPGYHPNKVNPSMMPMQGQMQPGQQPMWMIPVQEQPQPVSPNPVTPIAFF